MCSPLAFGVIIKMDKQRYLMVWSVILRFGNVRHLTSFKGVWNGVYLHQLSRLDPVTIHLPLSFAEGVVGHCV